MYTMKFYLVRNKLSKSVNFRLHWSMNVFSLASHKKLISFSLHSDCEKSSGPFPQPPSDFVLYPGCTINSQEVSSCLHSVIIFLI